MSAVPRLRVTFMSGPEDGRQLVFERPPLRIGREQDNELRIVRDPYVSRHHAELEWDGRGCHVIDRGSRNGTWQDGVRLEGRQPLRPGRLLRIGNTLLKVELESP